MSNFISLTVIMALPGSALIAGVFFAFCSFIMNNSYGHPYIEEMNQRGQANG
jgi:uncharacterized membrane protein